MYQGESRTKAVALALILWEVGADVWTYMERRQGVKGVKMAITILIVVSVGALGAAAILYLMKTQPAEIQTTQKEPEPIKSINQQGGQAGANITNNGPVYNAPIYGAGGPGGSPSVIGNNNVVIGGKGGQGGVGYGQVGAGGAGVHHGDNLTVIGGEGGGAPQADGRGGRGGGSGFFKDQILPDGHRLSDFGRGGDGASTPEYMRYHWVALHPDEMVAMRDPLRALTPVKVQIACNDGNCSELAASLEDFFDRLGWNDVHTVQAFDGNEPGLTIRPNSESTRAIANAIEKTTNSRLQINTRAYVSSGEEGIIIAIGKKPPP